MRAERDELHVAKADGLGPYSIDDRYSFTRPALLVLLLVEVALVVFFVSSKTLVDSQTFSRVFDLDGEQSAGTWFSAIQLSVIGLVLLVISRFAHGDRWPKGWFFVAAGLGFIFLSADEAISLHESVTRFANNRASWMVLFPDRHGAWIPLYLLLGVTCLALTWRSALLMLRVHRRQAMLGVLGGLIFVIGAVGVEIAGISGCSLPRSPRLRSRSSSRCSAPA